MPPWTSKTTETSTRKHPRLSCRPPLPPGLPVAANGLATPGRRQTFSVAFVFQENAIVERPQSRPAVRTMRPHHEDVRNDHVSRPVPRVRTRLSHPSAVARSSVVSFFLAPSPRTIQDPASQRLTWYRNPLSVLVIKKVRDMSVLPPFIQLVRWLIQVCIRNICKTRHSYLYVGLGFCGAK